ncbi:MAG: M48 family metalloprotease [Bacteroidetes bacterium]|nr:M48 family metalloprotease [Bacteroidota bacterium]
MNYKKVMPLLMMLVLLVTACAVNPVTGKKQLSFMSEAQEIAMGKQSDPAIIAQYGLYPNETLQDFIQEKGEAMAAISHRPGLDYEFKILDSDVVNAFAVPGGYIYFTRGIMAHFNNEAQFAGVLGHEIGHVAARHSAQQYTKQMIGQIAFIGGMIASEKFRDFAGEAMQGMQLLFLKFSRSAESESDVLGVDYSSTVGYDAHQMADFFKTLDRMSGGSEGRLPEFYSTHPDPGRRYNDVNKLTDKWHEEHNANPNMVIRDSYLEMINGIIYGEDPRQGYVEENTFYHPELKFQFPVPVKWQLMNSPSQVQMAPEKGDALMVFTLSQKSTLAEAATEIKTTYQLQNIKEKSFKVHGLNAYGMVSDYPQSDPSTATSSTDQPEPLAMQTVLIDYNDLIYVFHGLCEKKDYDKFEPNFDNTMLNFKTLTDLSKINVLPERIKVVSVDNATTVQQFLAQKGIPSDRLEEFAILNGMQLSDNLSAGTLVKLIEKRAGDAVN